MATKRWNSNKVKMNGLGGNAANVDDIKDAGLWGTVQDTPLVKGADGKTTTANFLSGMLQSLPPLHDVAGMAGLDLPDYLGKVKTDKRDEQAAPAAK